MTVLLNLSVEPGSSFITFLQAFGLGVVMVCVQREEDGQKRRLCIAAGRAGLVVLLTTVGCNRKPESGVRLEPPQISSHQKMKRVLAEIAASTPSSHPYLGTGKVEELRRNVLVQERSGNPFRRVVAYSDLGQEELNLGNVEVAIEWITKACDLYPQVRYPDEAVRDRFHNRLLFSLGTAYMRLGETENCCQQYVGESCIVPIRGAGLHTQTLGSRKAIESFLDLLERGTDESLEEAKVHFPARWLLNIAHMTLGSYPDGVPEKYLIPPSFFTSEVAIPRFTNIYPKLGLDTFNLSGGVVVDDFDDDGYLDIMTSTYDSRGQTQFFRNNRDGTFTERTREVGLTGILGGLNMVQADYDNDGDVDVFIMRGAWMENWGRHPNSLLRNDGSKFTDISFDAGLAGIDYPCKTAAWTDYDNDGDLDLYVGNESTDACPAASQLFQNRGNGTFQDVAEEAGLRDELFAMGATWGDYDNDRYPDLFVSSGGRNRLYRNRRDGTFVDVSETCGVQTPLASFPTWFWDFDNDGNLDLYVGCSSGQVGILAMNSLGTDIDSLTTSTRQTGEEVGVEMMALYRGDGKGGFVDICLESNLDYPALPMGANYGDVDNDGYLDFYLGTGDVHYSEVRPNVMFLNQAGKRFANVTMSGGFGHLQKGHGISFADLDHDGDQEIYVQTGGAFSGDRFNDTLFENPGFGNHWVTFQLVGRQSNRSAIGARIRADIVANGVPRAVYRQIGSGGSFGCNPLRQTIGIGKATRIERLEVYWPTSDITQVFHDVAADQAIRIDEGAEEYEPLQLSSFKF